jgi:hypothetical protein
MKMFLKFICCLPILCEEGSRPRRGMDFGASVAGAGGTKKNNRMGGCHVTCGHRLKHGEIGALRCTGAKSMACLAYLPGSHIEQASKKSMAYWGVRAKTGHPVKGNPEWVVNIRNHIVCVWEVCDRFIRICPQVAEKELSFMADDVDDYSSHGTEHSSEGRMQRTRLAVAEGGEGDLATLYAAIATFSRGQAILIEKMTKLERAVQTVQFDMTWVRDDMKAVHQVMERIAECFCDAGEAALDVDIGREELPVDDSPVEHWKGKEAAVDIPKPPSLSASRGEGQSGVDNVPAFNDGGHNPGNHIDVAEVDFQIVDVNPGRSVAAMEGRREWEYARVAQPVLRQTPWEETMINIEKEPLEDESLEAEMSCQSTPLQTPAVGRTMWSDFQTAVRDWPPTSVAATGFEEGWVPTKKGRWDTTEYAKDAAGPTTPAAGPTTPAKGGEYGATNLKFWPLRQGDAGGAEGRGLVASTELIGGATRKGGNGTGRGSGRGRGLPLVNPRFHTQVRPPSPSIPIFVCV